MLRRRKTFFPFFFQLYDISKQESAHWQFLTIEWKQLLSLTVFVYSECSNLTFLISSTPSFFFHSLNFAKHIYCFWAFWKLENTFQKQEGKSQHLTSAHIIKELSWNHDNIGAIIHGSGRVKRKTAKTDMDIPQEIAISHIFDLSWTGLCTHPWWSVRGHSCQNKTRLTKYSWSSPPWALRTFSLFVCSPRCLGGCSRKCERQL